MIAHRLLQVHHLHHHMHRTVFVVNLPDRHSANAMTGSGAFGSEAVGQACP